MSQPATAVAVVVLLAAYLIGSLPVAWLLGRWRRLELREVGSGNPGTSNLFRNAGVGAAVLSGPLQFAQGVVPVIIARAVGGDGGFIEIAAICAVVGNGWPIWLKFNGQRCIAVATGAAAAVNPALLVVLLICFAAGALGRAIAVGVLAGFAILPIAAAWIGGRELALTCCALLAAVVLRRLEGLTADLRRAGADGERGILLRRLFLDERPGQVLVGPREDSVPAKPRP
ncbi:MAG TPA: glycerol-3-phosphate acyltransferase [Candidatus Dormibacteraeota bacterium]|nr:glycerol-3-phosphate acyltransferase [Candidatus Dormibacteraeota bacterium]